MTKNVILCVLGTLGFCVILNAPKSKIIHIIVGSFICAGSYEIMDSIVGLSVFWSTLGATLITEAYSEIVARIFKMPATVILLASTIPLLPGGFLYYAMLNLVQNDYNKSLFYIQQTFFVAFAIALGSVIALIILNIIRFVKHYFTS